MRLHRIEYSVVTDAESALVVTHQEFAASEGAASKRMTEIKQKLKDTLDDKPTRAAVEIPTNKEGLIEWLNKNASVSGVEVAK